MTEFTVGRSYSTRLNVEDGVGLTYTVTARTPKFVTLRDRWGDERRVGVKTHDGVEWALPDGSYSMAPVIHADRPDPLPYVTVGPTPRRPGWFVAHREGDIIVHRRLAAGPFDESAARAEAAAMFPDHLVVLPDDPKPWKEPA